MFKMISKPEAEQMFGSVQQAIKGNKIMKIEADHYALVDYEYNGVSWHMDSIRRLSDKEMREHDLFCRYRYKAHVTQAPVGYCGTKYVHAGIYI